MKAKPTPTGGLTTPAKFHRFGKSFETRVDALSAKPPLTSPRSTTNERQANVGGEARRRVRVFWPEEDAWFAGFETVTEEQAKAGGGFYRTEKGKLRCRSA